METIKLELLSYVRIAGQLKFNCTKNGETGYILLINNEEDINFFSRAFNMRGPSNDEIKLEFSCPLFIRKVGEGRYVTRNQMTGQDIHFDAELIKWYSESNLGMSEENAMLFEREYRMESTITVPLEDIDIPTLMAIWYKEYMPALGSKREVNGKMCIDLVKMRRT